MPPPRGGWLEHLRLLRDKTAGPGLASELRNLPDWRWLPARTPVTMRRVFHKKEEPNAARADYLGRRALARPETQDRAAHYAGVGRRWPRQARKHSRFFLGCSGGELRRSRSGGRGPEARAVSFVRTKKDLAGGVVAAHQRSVNEVADPDRRRNDSECRGNERIGFHAPDQREGQRVAKTSGNQEDSRAARTGHLRKLRLHGHGHSFGNRRQLFFRFQFADAVVGIAKRCWHAENQNHGNQTDHVSAHFLSPRLRPPMAGREWTWGSCAEGRYANSAPNVPLTGKQGKAERGSVQLPDLHGLVNDHCGVMQGRCIGGSRRMARGNREVSSAAGTVYRIGVTVAAGPRDGKRSARNQIAHRAARAVL